MLRDQKAAYVRRLQADVGIAIETAKVVLRTSDPLDIARALHLSRAMLTKMKQNLFWASIYNLLAIPVAAGVLYPRFGIMLRPEWAALLTSLGSIVVATNAVLLKRVEGDLDTGADLPGTGVSPTGRPAPARP